MLGSVIEGVRRLISEIVGVMMSSEFAGNSPRGLDVRKKKTLRGCTGTSSFAIGHGESAVHGRFMYCVSLDERRAAGLAELE